MRKSNNQLCFGLARWLHHQLKNKEIIDTSKAEFRLLQNLVSCSLSVLHLLSCLRDKFCYYHITNESMQICDTLFNQEFTIMLHV